MDYFMDGFEQILHHGEVLRQHKNYPKQSVSAFDFTLTQSVLPCYT